ncbi:MAG: hypothetical protein Q9186_003491 [Xanthomendoza sp. 1 TL-2023]
MGRAGAYDAEEDRHRRRGRRAEEPEDYDDDDQPEYEHEQPRRRGKSNAVPKSRRVHSDEEAEEEESEDDDAHHKQIVVRKKSKKGKSSGKQVARKKRQESSDSEAETSEEESEEEEKPKKKKKKSKSHKKETVEILKWEPVSINDVDPDFITFVIYELGVVPKKFEDGIKKGLLLRDSQTGEYNIDRFFEKGILSASDKKSWKKLLAQNKNDPRLISSAHAGGGGPSRRLDPRMTIMTTPLVGPGMTRMDRRSFAPPRGHTRFDPGCEECADCRGPCFYGYDGFG